MDFKRVVLKYMRQIIISKQKLWKSATLDLFFHEFLCFDGRRPQTDKIPFRYVCNMHDASELIFHYLRQFMVIMLILGRVFGIEHPRLTIDNLYLKKTDHDHTFLFVVDKTMQFMMPCTHGYHIFISGFEECLFRRERHPLYLQVIPKRWSPYADVCKHILRTMNDIIPQPFKNLCKKMLSTTRVKLECTDDKEILLRILPLVHINSPNETTSPTSEKVVRKEIRKMFGIFQKEAEIMASKFTRRMHFYQLLEDWVDILSVYKDDFFHDPDTTVGVLRKVLYQYMIDHRFSHISFKTFDLSRMLVSLFLWSQWYEKLLVHLSILRDNDREDIQWIGCLETVLEKDSFTKVRGDLHVMDMFRRTSQRIPVDDNVNERLFRTHPMLRASYLYHTLDL